MRHGIANLYRPGNQAQAAVVALGVGVMFTLTVFLVQGALVDQIRGSAPPGMPNVFLLDIPANQRAALSELIQRQPGVKEAPEVAFAVAARITADRWASHRKPAAARFQPPLLRTRTVTSIDAMPPDTVSPRGRLVEARRSRAADLRQRGDRQDPQPQTRHAGRLEYLESQRAHPRGLHRTHRIHPHERPLRIPLQCRPARQSARGLLRQRTRPSADVAALQRVVYRKFPTVTVVNVADVMQIVEDVVQRIAAVIRFISGFTILAGAVMVASSVAGTRFRRMREVVTLKTLGATRRRIAWIFSVEFLALGTVAGLMGSLLAGGFAALVLKHLLEIDFHPAFVTHAVAVAIAALVATVAGWAASFRILGRKPLEILRDE